LFRFQLTQRDFSALLIQQSVILSWMYIFGSGISNRYPNLAPWSRFGFCFSAVISIGVADFLMRKERIHSHFAYAWSLISPLATLSLLLASEFWFFVAVCLLGALYGGFVLEFFANFGQSTLIGERGRIGALVGSIAVLVMSFLTVISLLSGFVGSVVLCSVLCVLSFLTTRLVTLDSGKSKAEEAHSLERTSGTKRDFFLYLVPWLIYNLVNALLGRYQTPLFIDEFQISILSTVFLSDLMSCIGALVGGFVSDLHGRRTALGIGLTSYGISTVLSGLIFLETQNALPMVLSLVLNGFSWGIFLVLFFFVVWEDLSSIYNSVSYYVALSFYPLSIGLSQFLPSETQFPLAHIALVGCLLIFSSNVFLVAAHELLPPEAKKEIGLFVYIEQAKALFKKRQKEHAETSSGTT